MTPRSTGQAVELRTIPLSGLELRAGGNGLGKLAGYAAVFNERSADLGGFVEIVRPGAFRDSLSGDVRSLWNHESGKPLGRTTAGTLRLAEDARGLRFELDLPDTTAGRDARESVRRGDVSQCSFGFVKIADSWDKATTPPTRYLERVRLLEVSPVTFPAYAATSVSTRALEVARSCPGGRCLTISARRAELQEADRALRALCGGRQAGSARSTRGRPPADWELRVLRSGRHRWKLRGVALHEAGHALGAVITGTGLAAVWLGFRRDSCGALEPSGGFIRPRREWRSAWPLLAGCAAEQRGGGRPQGRGPESDSLDLAQYREVVRRSGGDPNGSIDRDREHAEAVVDRHWPAVQAVADALLARGRLDGGVAEKLVLDALDSNTRARIQRAAA